MGKYIFKLSNYHAIKEAEIILEGITVLSGENGSGKSTISRWLYYLIRGTNDYEYFVDREAFNEIKPLVESIRRASMLLDYDSAIRGTQTRQMLNELWDKGIEAYQEKFDSIVESLFDSIVEELSDRKLPMALRRLSTIFQVDYSRNDSLDSFLGKASNKLHGNYYEIMINAVERKKRRDINSLVSVISNIASIGDGWPNDISLKEDSVSLLNKRGFQEPVMLNRAIYYGTQRTINSIEYTSEFDRLLRRPFLETPNQLRVIRMRIQSIIDGTISYEDENSLLMDEPGLYYSRNDGLRIPLKQAATGITSFAYLLQLLNNGYLQKDTLLIIDEPEAHLHPQWIVEYAKLLVLLNKKIGIKILISSHNPDMVSAIQSISRKEGIIDTVHFYVAQKRIEEDSRYTYKDLGTEIGEIFESFNIALSRIQMYGEQN
ncbi:MAG: AAA family ATPase [Bacteroidales bacterium]|nr:AAA family ATPase [Bacteroidales bacterium]